MTNNQKIAFNVVINLVSFAITIIISLFITPIVVETLGSEAYGFVGLAQNFVSYATLVTIALNSMASRFVSIEIYKNNYYKANRYFSSVFYANLLIAIVLTPILFGIAWKLEKFVQIPIQMQADVKITFAITFLQFIISVVLARYEIATFVTNKLYLNQKNSLIANFVRLGLTLICFSVFSVKLSYLSMATLVGVTFTCVMNVIYTKRYLPELRVNRKYFDFGYVKQLVASGSWNLLNKISSILLDGLDLLISNVFIGPVQMGALAVSKTVSTMFYSLRGTLDYPFTPPMTECYAKGDINGVIHNTRMGNKVLGIVLISPIATFIVYGKSFFELWVPSQDSKMIQILALLAMLNLLASACINSVFSVFTITNHVKIPALVTLMTGILTVIINFTLLKITNLGVYVIAGTSSILGMLRNYIFTPLYGAYCLKVKKSTFYHEIVTGNICLGINLIVGIGFFHWISSGKTWITLILSAGSMAVVCIIINFLIVLDYQERQFVYDVLKKKIIKKR